MTDSARPIPLAIAIVGVLRHKTYLKAALHSTNVSIGTIVVYDNTRHLEGGHMLRFRFSPSFA